MHCNDKTLFKGNLQSDEWGTQWISWIIPSSGTSVAWKFGPIMFPYRYLKKKKTKRPSAISCFRHVSKLAAVNNYWSGVEYSPQCYSTHLHILADFAPVFSFVFIVTFYIIEKTFLFLLVCFCGVSSHRRKLIFVDLAIHENWRVCVCVSTNVEQPLVKTKR